MGRRAGRTSASGEPRPRFERQMVNAAAGTGSKT